MIGQASIAAGVAVVGNDLLQNQRWNISSRRRLLQGVSFVGSTAINDCECDLFIEDKFIIHLFNTRAGVLAPLQEDAIPLGRLYVPPGAKISAVITNAAVGNPVIIRLY